VYGQLVLSLLTWRRCSFEHTGHAAGKFISTLLSTRQDTMLRQVNVLLQLLTTAFVSENLCRFDLVRQILVSLFPGTYLTHQYSVALEIVGRRSFYFRVKLLEKTNRYYQKDKSLLLSTGRLALGIQSVKSLESKLYTALTR
jgi:hypothetical protein